MEGSTSCLPHAELLPMITMPPDMRDGQTGPSRHLILPRQELCCRVQLPLPNTIGGYWVRGSRMPTTKVDGIIKSKHATSHPVGAYHYFNRRKQVGCESAKYLEASTKRQRQGMVSVSRSTAGLRCQVLRRQTMAGIFNVSLSSCPSVLIWEKARE